MRKLKYLIVQFDRNLQSYEIPYFRASVIENTKRQSDLFHNHVSDTEVIYRYPLIQYKIINRKPSIVCIDAATNDIHYLLENREFHFDIKGKVDKYEIEELYLKYFTFQTWDSSFSYHLHNYMPFNQENYSLYKKLGSQKRQMDFLEELLQKHLSLICQELNAFIPIELTSEVTSLKSEKYIEYKGVFHQTYCLNFKTNLTLPNYIGIGKGVSNGFGLIKQIGNDKR